MRLMGLFYFGLNNKILSKYINKIPHVIPVYLLHFKLNNLLWDINSFLTIIC